MGKKYNLARVIGPAILKKALKYKECMAVSFQMEAKLSPKYLCLDSDSPC